jgi:argininosuccinate lyase
MREINASIATDQILYRQDIAGSRAHAAMLESQGILSAEEARAILDGLAQIEQEISDGKMTFDPALEDIHMHVEARLRELIGADAGKLHTARSRNDQVATDFRLWVREAIDTCRHALRALRRTLLERAERETDTLMPGYTHLQPAQPVSFAHHLMAYVEMFARDDGRLGDCRRRVNESPLGAAALAGTSFPIDRFATSRALGFARPMANSMDAVAARDFALEYLACLTILAGHLSRLAEEIVLWTSPPFNFVSLSDAFTTGSSIMPQKRNADAAELVRAKVGKMAGAFQQLVVVLKALPLTYGKDMQEDKAPVFTASADMMLALEAMTGMVGDLTPNRERMAEAAEIGYVTATDLADWLVERLKLPFRDAHHVTGHIIRLAEARRCRLDELPLADMQAIEPRIEADIAAVLTPRASMERRLSFGGTAPLRVREALARARAALQQEERGIS